MIEILEQTELNQETNGSEEEEKESEVLVESAHLESMVKPAFLQTGRPVPLNILVAGAAGTGKSSLVDIVLT